MRKTTLRLLDLATGLEPVGSMPDAAHPVVCRVEDAAGIGPYQICDSWAPVRSGLPNPLGGALGDERHPGPAHDTVEIPGWSHRCNGNPIFGFASHQQACQWWGLDELRDMPELCPREIYMVVYEVRECWHLGHQVIFCRDSAVVVERMTVQEFFQREKGEK